MKSSEELERTRSLALTAVFVCSILLCASFLFPIHHSWRHAYGSFPLENAFSVGDLTLIVVMSVAAFWRWWALKKHVKGRPPLRSVSEDERVKSAWLRSYRPAFFVLLAIQIASKAPTMIRRPWDVPFQSALTLSAAIAVSVGAFLHYSREGGHD
jgi:hypothetical protein